MSTYGELIDKLAVDLGEKSDDTDVRTLLLGKLQDGIDEIVAACPANSDFMKITGSFNATTSTVTLVAPIIEFIAMKHTDDNTALRFIEKSELIRRGYKLDNTGKPLIWYDETYDETVSAYTFGFYPVPDATYEITYTARRHTAAIEEADDVFLPQRFLPVLGDFVRWQFNLDDGSLERADRFERKYLRGLQAAISERPIAKRYIPGEKAGGQEFYDSRYVQFWSDN